MNVSFMKQRIDYIDRLKGLAIFLVVMRHVYGMAFSLSNDIFYKFIFFSHAVVYVLFWIGCLFCYKTSLLGFK